jgi:hypothetical protein
MKYRNEYRYSPRFGHPEHIWTCTGAKGAMHFHVTDLGEFYKHGERYTGGLEQHSRQPFGPDEAPGQEKCWLLGGPCWHDGSSTYAHERLIPFWLSDPHDHERMFRLLEQEYERRFNGEEQ